MHISCSPPYVCKNSHSIIWSIGGVRSCSRESVCCLGQEPCPLIYTQTHTHTHTHTHVYIYIYIYPLAGSRTMLSYMYTCINTYMCIYIYVYVCVIINLCWLGQEQCSLVLARHLTVCIIFPMSCASFSPCS
jgi:hypothetical protein